MNELWRLLNTPMRDDWRSLVLAIAMLATVAALGVLWYGRRNRRL